MPITDTGRKNKNQTTGTGVLQVTLTGTAAGSLIVVGFSAFGAGGPPTCSVSDNVNGAYSQAFQQGEGGDQSTGVFYFPNNAGGSLTISLTRSPSDDAAVYAHEFAGVALSAPLSGTPVSTGSATGTTANTGNMTPADNDVLLVASLVFNNIGSITQNQGGQGFTLSNELEGTTGQPGSMVYKIISGPPGTPNHSWSLPSASGWACGIAAFKPATAAAAASLLVPPMSPAMRALLMQ
jgi:hypothetical protein